MNRMIRLCAAGLLTVTACNVEHWDDECYDDSWEEDEHDDAPVPVHQGGKASVGSHSAAGETHDDPDPGTSPSAGSAAGGSAASGGSSAGGSAGGTSDPGPIRCQTEDDCPAGFNCDLEETHECLPAEQETCGELGTEQACNNRVDCMPIYAGINCSCGQDCECRGGEPGCICESFDFFACQVLAE